MRFFYFRDEIIEVNEVSTDAFAAGFHSDGGCEVRLTDTTRTNK